MARDMLAEVHGVVMVTQRGCRSLALLWGAPVFMTYIEASVVMVVGGHESVLRSRNLREAQPVHYITFLDDTFTLAPSWI